MPSIKQFRPKFNFGSCIAGRRFAQFCMSIRPMCAWMDVFPTACDPKPRADSHSLIKMPSPRWYAEAAFAKNAGKWERDLHNFRLENDLLSECLPAHQRAQRAQLPANRQRRRRRRQRRGFFFIVLHIFSVDNIVQIRRPPAAIPAQAHIHTRTHSVDT